MNNATRAQGLQHLRLIDDQGLDLKESDTLNLYLPALAAGIKRRKIPPLAEFRKFVGLGVLERLPLEISIPALTEPFDPKDKFNVDISDNAAIKISYHGGNFQSWMLTKIVDVRAGYGLEAYTLTADTSDKNILQEAEREDVDTDPAVIHFLVSQQPRGEKGPSLLNDGKANIFYVPRKVEEQGKIRAVRRAVCVYWGCRGWRFYAFPLPSANRWRAGYRVFFRKRVGTVSA